MELEGVLQVDKARGRGGEGRVGTTGLRSMHWFHKHNCDYCDHYQPLMMSGVLLCIYSYSYYVNGPEETFSRMTFVTA